MVSDDGEEEEQLGWLKDCESVVLSRDVVLLRGMPLPLQKRLCQALHSCPPFFSSRNEKTHRVDMLHLGLHEGRDGFRMVASIPPLYTQLAKAAHAHVADRHGMLRSVPLIESDVAVVNAYKRDAKLGMHVDRRSARHCGIPVVAISLGESAEFVFKNSWRARAQPNHVMLRSGDVLVFGGKARGIVHGIERLVPGSAPYGVCLGEDSSWCRICITLRQS